MHGSHKKQYGGFGVWALRRSSSHSVTSSASSNRQFQHNRRKRFNDRPPSFNDQDPKWICCFNKHVLLTTKYFCVFEMIIVILLTGLGTCYIMHKHRYNAKHIQIGSPDFIDSNVLVLKLVSQCVTLGCMFIGLFLHNRWMLLPNWILRFAGYVTCLLVYALIRVRFMEPILSVTSIVLLIELPLVVFPIRCFEFLAARDFDQKYWKSLTASKKQLRNPRLVAIQSEESQGGWDSRGVARSKESSGQTSTAGYRFPSELSDDVIVDSLPQLSTAQQTSSPPPSSPTDSGKYRFIHTNTGKTLAIPIEEQEVAGPNDAAQHSPSQTPDRILKKLAELKQLSTVNEESWPDLNGGRRSNATDASRRSSAISKQKSTDSELSACLNAAQVEYMFSSSRRSSYDMKL